MRGAERFARRHGTAVFATEGTWAGGEAGVELRERGGRIRSGEAVEVPGFRVEAFSLPHDAREPVGYVVEDERGRRLGLVADLGCASRLAWGRLADLDLLLLESNHDLGMLRRGPYPWVLKQLKIGQSYVFSGKVQSYLGRLTMRNPEFEEPDSELLRAGRLAPVYPLTKGISAKWMRNTQKKVVSEWGRRVHDYLPESVRQQAGLMTLAQVLEQVHFPDDLVSLQAARQRLAFDELFVIQIGVLRQRQEYRSLPTQSFPLDT